MTLEHQLVTLDNLIQSVEDLVRDINEINAKSAASRAEIERLDREIEEIMSGTSNAKGESTMETNGKIAGEFIGHRSNITDWVMEHRAEGFSWHDMRADFDAEARRLSDMFMTAIMNPCASEDLAEVYEAAKAFQKRYGAFIDVWFEYARESEVRLT